MNTPAWLLGKSWGRGHDISGKASAVTGVTLSESPPMRIQEEINSSEGSLTASSVLRTSTLFLHVLFHVISTRPHEGSSFINPIFARWENWGTEQLGDLSEVAQLVSDRVGIQTPGVRFLSPWPWHWHCAVSCSSRQYGRALQGRGFGECDPLYCSP